MTANSTPALTPAPGTPAVPRFDRKFIEEHRIFERYLEDQLPAKGAREFEVWCRANPDFLEEKKLGERSRLSLALLEASGRPVDLSEPSLPWWKTVYVPIGLGVLALISLAALLALFSKYIMLNGELDRARTLASQGALSAPSAERSLRVTPDRASGIGAASVKLSRGAAQLIELHIDMEYSRETQFRVFVDKRDQGRALVIDRVLKDSNNELKIAFNASGLAAGFYDVRIEALPARGDPIPEGWLVLDVS
jgi:hypothetical protein